MKIENKQAWFQGLFERMADAYGGTLILDDIWKDGCKLTFLDESDKHVTTVLFGLRDLGDRVLVRVSRPDAQEAEEPVLVSPAVSAVIAVCTR